MRLNLSQIKDITIGAVRVEEKNGLFNFFRFTKEQEDLYKNRWQDFYMKTFSTAGIRLLFKTNSTKISLTILTEQGSSRSYFSLDVFSEGKPVGYIDNFSDFDVGNYHKSSFVNIIILPILTSITNF